MDLLEALKKRRDTRHFTADPVPESVFNEALTAPLKLLPLGSVNLGALFWLKEVSLNRKF